MGKLANKRIALYARYSSDNQREASLDDQLRRCEVFVRAHGGQVDPRLTFTDAGVTGATMERPGMRRLRAALEAGVVDAIVVEDVSRLSRDLADSAELFRHLTYLKVPLFGVADGIDTSASSAKIHFTFKSLANDMYRDDLSDKTKRGQEGRWLAGLSTGSPALGYKSTPVPGPTGKPIGYRVEIDEVGAAIVRRIFQLYDGGDSKPRITARLNSEHVPPPRARTAHAHKGWVASTIGEILKNEVYIGKWKWRQREWVRDPRTGRRKPRPRNAAQVMTREFPERRIIEQELWESVQARRVGVAAKYTGQRTGGIPTTKTVYPLSGILRCAKCCAPMTITRGTSASYYACSDRRKRGTCDNALSVREDLARACIFEALRSSLFTSEAVDFIRKRIAERLGEIARTSTAELRERTARLLRTEERIGGLVRFVEEGNHSKAVRDGLMDLEAQAEAERFAIRSLKAQAGEPVSLPTPEVVLKRAQELDRVFRADPTLLRETLRRFFKDGRILLHPQPDGTYIAEGTMLPLVALAEMTNPRAARPGGRCPPFSCAGRI